MRIRRTLICAEALEPRRLLAVTPAGSEFQVNTFTTDTQSQPAVAQDSDGDFVVVWEGVGTGDNSGVFAQRYNAAGVAQGAEFRVNSFTTNSQSNPSIAMDSDGDFVIAWDGAGTGDSIGVFAQRYDAAGAAQGAEFRVNNFTTSGQGGSSIAMASDGDFVIAWSGAGTGDTSGVFAQRYDSAGVAQGGEFGVNAVTTDLQGFVTAAMDSDGDFVIAWVSYYPGGSDYDVYARRYDSAGVAQGVEQQVNAATTNLQFSPRVCMDADGDFVVVWSSYTATLFPRGAFARRFDSAGAPLGAEFRVSTVATTNQSTPTVTMDAGGAFVIAWSGNPALGGPSEIAARCFDSTGVADGDEFQVNTYTTNPQWLPAVAVDSDGDIVVAWTSNGQDGAGFGVFAQRFAVPDVAPPAVNSSSLEFATQQAVSITFNEPLDSATVGAADLTALNLDNASTPIANSVVLSGGDTIATWIFNTPGTFISDGDYTFTLPAGAVSDVAGNALAAQHQVTGPGIWFLGGDANRDRVVNANDFSVLATNFGTTGKNFSQGDFNYDTIVNANDFSILATRFGTALAPISLSHRGSPNTRVGNLLTQWGNNDLSNRDDEGSTLLA